MRVHDRRPLPRVIALAEECVRRLGRYLVVDCRRIGIVSGMVGIAEPAGYLYSVAETVIIVEEQYRFICHIEVQFR